MAMTSVCPAPDGARGPRAAPSATRERAARGPVRDGHGAQAAACAPSALRAECTVLPPRGHGNPPQ